MPMPNGCCDFNDGMSLFGRARCPFNFGHFILFGLSKCVRGKAFHQVVNRGWKLAELLANFINYIINMIVSAVASAE